MIYFIRSGEFVKIGHCARDPIRRLEKLQIGNPVTLELIGIIPNGTRYDEQQWHLKFDKWRVRGEWFKLDRKLLWSMKPHRVDHAEWSANRPDRMMNGVPAWQVHAYLEGLEREHAARPVERCPEIEAEIERLSK